MSIAVDVSRAPLAIRPTDRESVCAAVACYQLDIPLKSFAFSAEAPVSSVLQRMGAMKQVAESEPVIVIEWNGLGPGQQPALDARHLSKDDLLNLARALGRLQARRDLARGAAAVAAERPSSGAKSAMVKDMGPVRAPVPSDIAE